MEAGLYHPSLPNASIPDAPAAGWDVQMLMQNLTVVVAVVVVVVVVLVAVVAVVVAAGYFLLLRQRRWP